MPTLRRKSYRDSQRDSQQPTSLSTTHKPPSLLCQPLLPSLPPSSASLAIRLSCCCCGRCDCRGCSRQASLQAPRAATERHTHVPRQALPCCCKCCNRCCYTLPHPLSPAIHATAATAALRSPCLLLAGRSAPQACARQPPAACLGSQTNTCHPTLPLQALPLLQVLRPPCLLLPGQSAPRGPPPLCSSGLYTNTCRPTLAPARSAAAAAARPGSAVAVPQAPSTAPP